MNATIRPYRGNDKAAVYDVCVRTVNAGRGVRGRYSTDDLVPDIVAGPYLFLEPRHAHVLDNGERAVGYIIGTASTPDFVAGYRDRWLPRLRDRYQQLSGPPLTEEEQRLDVMFHPERWLLSELAPHPAHLHINLLTGYRRSGHGRELMSTFLASVAAAGASSCYLSVRRDNVDARRFTSSSAGGRSRSATRALASTWCGRPPASAAVPRIAPACGAGGHTAAWSSIASATLRNPAILAPTT